MTIDPTRLNDIRARAAAAAAEASEVTKKEQPAQARQDQVEISDEARELAAQGGADRLPVTEARLAEIQERLDSGYYDRPDVVREIAERLLDSEDL